MLCILDSNEYIFALGAVRKPECERVLREVVKRPETVSVRIPRLIIEEVRHNLTPEAFKDFIILANTLTKIDEDVEVPFELGGKYEFLGLKPSDAFIAAFCEWTGVEALVTENRHFLSRQANLPFKVITAESCLRTLLR